MDVSYSWMIYIREKSHEAGKSLPAAASSSSVVVTAPLLRSFCGFAVFWSSRVSRSASQIAVFPRSRSSSHELYSSGRMSITAFFFLYYFFFLCFSQLITQFLLFLPGAVWILSGRRLEQGSKTTFFFKIALASQPEESSRCFQHSGGHYQRYFAALFSTVFRRIAPSASPLLELVASYKFSASGSQSIAPSLTLFLLGFPLRQSVIHCCGCCRSRFVASLFSYMIANSKLVVLFE